MSPLVILLLLAACAAAYGLSRWFTALSRDWALKHGIVSHVTHRSSHTIPTARLGGVGLALGFGVAAALFVGVLSLGPYTHGAGEEINAPRYGLVEALFNLFHNPGLSQPGLYYAGLVAGWALMLAVGLLDDVYDLPPLVKLGLTIVAALLPLLCGVTFNAAAPLGLPRPAAWVFNVGLSLFWILFFVNAFNFMDGMDGFAAGFARLAALAIFGIFLIRGLHQDVTPWHHVAINVIDPGYVSWREPFMLELLLLPVLAAACWGFLHWNNPPAKVFMGDGGAFSLGYLLAITVICAAQPAVTPAMRREAWFPFNGAGALVPVLSSLTVLFPFIFDVTLTLIRRTLRGENILHAHREHLYQRLMKTGLSHAEVLKICKRTFLACNGAALVGVLVRHPAGRWAALGFAVCVMLDYWRFTLRREHAQLK